MRDSRLMFCWELGSGSGHLTGLIRVAESFVECGATCSFVIPEPTLLNKLKPEWRTKTNVHVFQSPIWSLQNPAQALAERTYTFADVLSQMGFLDANVIQQNLVDWDRILQQANPNVAICEFAPGCIAAARGRFPCIAFGNGYYVLPNVSQLPSITAWDPELPESSIQRELKICDLMNQTRGKLGLSNLSALSQFFRGDHTLVCSFQSLDPYQAIRKEPTYCPFNIAYPARLTHRHADRPVFVYFSFPHPAIQHFLQLVLSQRNIPCVVYAPPYSDQLMPCQGINGHRFLEKPMDLQGLNDFSLCIHHGGFGVASTAAVAGIPQLILPVNLEHAITAQALCRQQSALMCMPEMVMSWTSPESLLRGVQTARRLPMRLESEFHVSSEKSLAALTTIRSLCVQVGK